MIVTKSRVLLLLVALLLTACGGGAAGDAPADTPPPGGAADQDVSDPQSVDSVPLAARVNGTPIHLEGFIHEVMREENNRRAANLPIPEDRADFEREVLDGMIEAVLIEQAAETLGITLSEETLEAEVMRSITEAGGNETWNAWLAMSNLTPEEYRQQLRTQLIGGMVTDWLAGQVPTVAEQVHARHILVASENEAQDIINQLATGADFAELARGRSLDAGTRESGGDLAWFTRGQLLEDAVEEAAFALQPGEVSGIVASSLGYHIVQTLERDPARPLDDETRQNMLQIAIENWRQELWAEADVQRLVGAGS